MRSTEPINLVPRILRSYKEKGIKAVLNLRGFTQQSYALFEEDSCKNLGLDLISVPLSGSSAPQPEKLLEIIDIMEKFQSHLFCTVSRELIVPV
jgi:3-dehydroquinate dehydratase